MEALLQNLQEQQIQLQQENFCIHDLENMENLNDGKPPLPPPRKYVSIFRIDGEPILPPLMTTEKRRQMHILKEKALKIEQRLRDHKQQAQCENGINSEISNPSLCHTSVNNSQRSQDFYENKLKETEDAMALLKNLMQRQQGGNEDKCEETACSTSTCFHRNRNKEKLEKLQKSEILIYDNSTNEVIQVPAEKEKKTKEDQLRLLKEIECQTNFKRSVNKKPSHLLLAGVNTKGTTAIPSICLNPPTPLTVNKSLCETLSDTESGESLHLYGTLNNSVEYGHELSSDESLNSMITQSDKKPNRNSSQISTKAENGKNFEEKPVSPTKNVCEKIQQFETISSVNNTPQTSPEKLFKNRKTCLETPTTGTLSRSATSPSIKLNSSNRSSSSRSQSLVEDLPENTLVRSSSFTLETPSKALIEHMQQQKANGDRKAVIKSPLNETRNLTRKSANLPLRAHRDTVESKAKKVQKVELKSSRQKLQQKASQSKLSQAAAASSTSPFNPNSLCKLKRSPYEKSSHTSLQTLQKTSSTQMRKLSSSSSSYNMIPTKTSKSKLTSSPSTLCNAVRSPQTNKESINQMAKAQQEKFMQLLAQQEEEHQRLQQAFEMQQRLLLDQLNREMTAASQLKSPNNFNIPSPITSNTQTKICDKQQNQINSTAFSLDHNFQRSSFEFKQHRNNQPSPSSISNNSSYISIDKSQSQSQSFNAQRLMYDPHYNQTSQPIPLNNSHFSLMDHSNANTSLDISTLSTQTSPDITNETAVHNGVDNKTPSSRRRLFAAEMNNVAVKVNTLSFRSIASPPYSPGQQCFGEQGHQLNHNNKSLTNERNKRPPVVDNLLLHDAATKINAYARGFLVRRLFQTEQIQRIVQTIRDTLIFVLNLHIETIENPQESYTPANIKLKARLLQQLSSACRTLHLVFFQTSIKERMEIIARDRKRIKTKLMSINHQRAHRIAD